MAIYSMASYSCTTLQGYRQPVKMLACRSRLPPAYQRRAICTSARMEGAVLHSSSVQCEDASLASCSHTPTLSPLVLFGLVEAARWTILPHAAQASVAQGVIAAVRDSIPDPLIVLLLAAMPLVELRGAIPVGCDSHCSFSWLREAQRAAAWSGPLAHSALLGQARESQLPMRSFAHFNARAVTAFNLFASRVGLLALSLGPWSENFALLRLQLTACKRTTVF